MPFNKHMVLPQPVGFPMHAPKFTTDLPPRDSIIISKRAPRTIEQSSFSDALVDVLARLGVEHAFGVFGGAIAPFSHALEKGDISLLHFRHEAGAAFAAIESSLATGKLTVVLATTGPGLTNMLTGMAAARVEGAKVLFVSGSTSAAQRGRMAFQETSPCGSLVSHLYAPGPVFHYANFVEDPAELDVLASRLAVGITQPGGFVAHLGLPLSSQTAVRTGNVNLARISNLPPACDGGLARECAELLASEPFVIWAGFGARSSAPLVRRLSELTGAPVMCTPRGKGIVSENDPRYLGVTGLGGHAAVTEYFRTHAPARVLVLGSRLSEMSSFWSPALLPTKELIHVDVDPDVFGRAYPNAETIGVHSEVGAFLRALLEELPKQPRLTGLRPVSGSVDSEMRPWDEEDVRPTYLMSLIQEKVVEETDSVVITEAGNAFALGSHYLHFPEAGRYRVSSGFGSMGHATAGVIGAALGTRKKAFAIVGDGSMLMLNEVNTAATYGVDAVWIVLNDARYGMIAQGMESIGWQPFQTDFARTDFVAVARAMGADGVRVEREQDLAAALERAVLARGPFVVDVMIDPRERPPNMGRNQSLVNQGVNGSAG